MRIKNLAKIFSKHSVGVTGMIGSGKDMLISNVIERRSLPHVSNCPYNKLTIPYDYNALRCGDNTYKNFVENNVNKYDFPYFDGCDIYLSDTGIYFPSQYCNELNRDYKNLPTFMALSRQLGQCRVHSNCQNLNRVWDKIREMHDVFIRCKKCIVLFGGRLVIQTITIYDRAESCIARLSPCRIRIPLICSNERRDQIRMYKDNFFNTHGSVKNHILIYRNKSKYDTRHFKSLLKGGKIIERQNKADEKKTSR